VGAGAPQNNDSVTRFEQGRPYGIFMDTKLMESILQQGK
jgi:hypothetical protein